ncbi:beta-galactosidase [Streptomyces lonarensis]|uniref:Beta-galactosidase n=1 Tax=Streptomyces lonarensis TaxID=700599 RepID=A0A7X6D4Y3_9ACTN|nr:beta-galactosidase [Streptomyces lonarensis]NJQ08247.1 beta-galactosidase [Streptomyces lonarensis]
MPSSPAPRPRLGDATRGRLLFGGDYNPEQWPEEVWAEDAALMRQAGVTTATVGVFSWSTIEPRPGAREFAWLDRVMDLLHDHGVGVVLATPTASPPPWLGARHPETLPRAEDGTVVTYGSRQQFCPSSPVYRRYATALTEDVAARYADHPALLMWHVNNEYSTHCWCDTTAAHFRRWLADRHGTVDALNTAWGTAFWSQRYDDWSEVLPPRRAQYIRNPAQALDFRRFTSDALLECYLAERDIVARHTPHIPVTTNFMPLWSGLDGWRWARHEDVVSVDSYPDPADPVGGAARHALTADLTRGQAANRPWFLMEQAAGAVNWRAVNRPKPRGMNRLHSLQAVARGADAVCYFQWRQSRQGAEKYHSAMLPHAGPDSRSHAEIRQIGAELARLGPDISGTEVAAEVAVLHDWPSWWAADGEARPSALVTYEQLLTAWHRALWEENLTTTLAHPGADLTGYRLVVAPCPHLLTDTALRALTRYVASGGHLVCGFFSGVVDQDDRIHAGGMAAGLRRLLGIDTLHTWWPLGEGETVHCDDGTTGTLWSEELTAATGTETVTAYRGGELDGLPAVLRNGRAWYVSTLPEPAALRGLLRRVAAAAGATPVLDSLPTGVEAVRRGPALFLLNHGPAEADVPLPAPHTDVLTGEEHARTLRLERYGVAVLRPTGAAE